MAFNFPDAPLADEEFTPPGGPTYIWKTPRWVVKNTAAPHTHPESEVVNLVSDLAAKAPLASPALTGAPTAPTAPTATNTIQIATTAFVQANMATKANTVHTHTQGEVTNLVTDLGLKAPLASPTFTGVPAAPTAAVGTSTTQVATTAFVQAAGNPADWSGKASVVDADVIAGADSAAAFMKVRWTWATLKAAIGTFFGLNVNQRLGPYYGAGIADADLAVESGSYLVNVGTLNIPVNNAGWLNVFAANLTNVTTQYLTVMDTAVAMPRQFVRRRYAGAYGAWMETTGVITELINKPVLTDVDRMPMADGDSAFARRHYTFAQLKATLATYFNTLYLNLAGPLNTVAGLNFIAQAEAADPSASAYTPGVTGKGNMRYVLAPPGVAFTFNAPAASPGKMFTMVVMVWNNAGALPSFTFAGFAKVSGDAPAISSGGLTLCYITRIIDQTTVSVERVVGTSTLIGRNLDEIIEGGDIIAPNPILPGTDNELPGEQPEIDISLPGGPLETPDNELPEAPTPKRGRKRRG